MDYERPIEDLEHAAATGYMSEEAFTEACYSLVERSPNNGIIGMGLRCQGEGDDRYLIITQPLLSRSVESASEMNLDSIEGKMTIDDDEDEAAIHHFSPSGPGVEYNVLLSPAYRVPVLYFFLCDIPPLSPQGIDAVYSFLVPEHYKSGLREVGVMGGISMSNHPVTDAPVFFIHPCNTAEAMREILGKKEVAPLHYLQIWMGLVGACVGLYLPKELVLDRPAGREGLISFNR